MVSPPATFCLADALAATEQLLAFHAREHPEALPATAGPEGKAPGVHYRHAGLGVWAVRRGQPDPSFYAWKDDPAGREPATIAMARELAELIRAWQPARASTWTITTPPAGASAAAGKPYAAGYLGRKLAELLELDYLTALERRGRKKYHGRHYTLVQDDFTVKVRPPAVCLVVDDVATSGTTMKLALRALRSVGVPAFGFTVWGND